MLIGSKEKENLLIRIVDDEREVREALALLLDCEDWKSISYESAEDFLSQDRFSAPGCLLCDVKMPAMNGLQLQQIMMQRDITLPIIFITGHGDIEMAVECIQQGAVDFLVKPVKEEKLFAAIGRAVEKSLALAPESELRESLERLSEREKSTLLLILQGLGTRAIAQRLGIGERTVQGHRWRIYQKMGLNSESLLRERIREEWLA